MLSVMNAIAGSPLFSAENIDQSAVMIAKQSGLSAMTLKVMRKDVENQSFLNNKVTFENAMRQALKSFLNDGSDAESPLAVILNQGFPRREAKTKLLAEMNSPRTVLKLLPISEIIEGGEDTEKYWIFELNIDDYDYSFWAIIDRSGVKPVYNYGFN